MFYLGVRVCSTSCSACRSLDLNTIGSYLALVLKQSEKLIVVVFNMASCFFKNVLKVTRYVSLYELLVYTFLRAIVVKCCCCGTMYI